MTPIKRTPLNRPPRYNTFRVVLTGIVAWWVFFISAAALIHILCP